VYNIVQIPTDNVGKTFLAFKASNKEQIGIYTIIKKNNKFNLNIDLTLRVLIVLILAQCQNS